MKRCGILIATFLFCRFAVPAAITHTIRYHCDGASEVFLVWGINNWQLPKNTPAGSQIKDKLVYTAMREGSDGTFIADVSVDEETSVIDFVFHITRGPLGKSCDIWDANQKPYKDYHAVACANVETHVHSSAAIPPAAQVSGMDGAWFVLAGTALLMLVVILLRKRFSADKIWPRIPGIIICSSLALVVCHGLMRPAIAGISWPLAEDPLATLPLVLRLLREDMIYILSVCLFFLLIDRFVRRSLVWRRINLAVFFTVALVSAVWSITNERMVLMIGRPLNYQWLYYGDLLRTGEGWSAVAANLSPGYLLSLIVLLISTVLCAVGCMQLWILLTNFRRPVRLSLASACLLPVVWIGSTDAGRSSISSEKVANPVFAMARSLNPFNTPPALFTAEVPDSLKFQRLARSAGQKNPSLANVKNVVLIVLESTGAAYVDYPEKKFGVTPFLQQISSRGWSFSNIYAPAPATNLSMYGLVTGSYPWVSSESVTDKFADLSFPSLASVLKKCGYQTAFFNSGDNDFQQAGRFLRSHGFDNLSDCNDKACPERAIRVDNTGWKNMNGRDDACTADQMLNWIGKQNGQPFLAMMWTYQTHYPYFAGSASVSLSPDEKFNRYLSALNYCDGVVASVYARLEKLQLLESTLIVIVGDHGEAFGQHGQFTHAQAIYEENLRVPCIFYNPNLESKYSEVAGSVTDVAPTILSLLGVDIPSPWDGVDLASRQPDSPVFYFASWSGEHFGMRRGPMKFIFEAGGGTYELYDLDRDPNELNNLATGRSFDKECLQLAGWVQHVNRRFPQRNGF